MNIKDFLPVEAVLPDVIARTRKDLFAELVAPLLSVHPELKGYDVVRALCEREKLGSTAVGEGVAIPHCKSPGLTRMAIAAGRSRQGIEFGTPPEQQELCHIFFLILAPENEAGQHLKVLAQLARRAKDAVFRSEILLAAGQRQLWQTITAP